MFDREPQLNAGERVEILRLAKEAAAEAGQLLLEHQARLDPAQVGTKTAARDLVTAADLASERLIVSRLRTSLPGHAIEAEEEVVDQRDRRPRWFLDPLDGTVNYVHKIPFWAVSMGLWVEGVPEVAVVHAPALGETFTASRWGGAALNGRPMSVSRARNLAEAILATGFPYRRSELAHSNLENFGRFFHDVRDLRRMGSAALDLAYVAAGRFDGFWELHLSPHDVAAGALLVKEAGGLVTDADGADDWLRGGHIVAAGRGIHEAIRERIEH